MPRISVIRPAYSGELPLRRAAESLKAQTCGDWELLLTDSVPGQALVAEDSRIRILPSGDIRAMLAAAAGGHIAFLAGESRLAPTAFAVMLTGALKIC